MPVQPWAIDVHQHVVPPQYARWLNDRQWHLPVPAWTPDAALAAMDARQVEAAVLSVTTPGLYAASGADARRLARSVNEFCAELTTTHRGRFGFFATLTLPDVDGALDEAAYALDELAADGIVLLTNAGGRDLGDPLFRPLFAELDRRGAVVLIHPTFPAAVGPPVATGNPRSDVYLLAETTRTAVDLITAGTITRSSRLRVILSHAGGYLPYMSHRIAPMCSPDGDYGTGLAVLRQFYFDTALSASGMVLPALLAFAAPGHVLFGSDWPYATSQVLDHFQDEFLASDLTAGQRTEILRAAAERVIPRLAAATT